MYFGQKNQNKPKKQNRHCYFVVVRAGIKTSIAQLKTRVERHGKHTRFWQRLTF